LTNPTTIWRLIPPIETTGQLQMQIDRWLLQQHILGQIPPTLRFYTWSQPTISLGYHQQHYPEHWRSLVWHDSPQERLAPVGFPSEGTSEFDHGSESATHQPGGSLPVVCVKTRQRLRQRPVDLVKRPTGGRGVLHQGDLTYAFIGSGFGGKRAEVYQQICQFLIDGWRSIGVDLEYGTAGTGYIHNPNCFGTATSADLVCADGYKLIGSAQLIKSGAILQHGSMRLNPDPELFEKVFGESIAPPSPAILALTIDRIIDVLVSTAASNFQVQFDIQPLSDREWSQIQNEAQAFD
jgi:lipoate---protein ligase